MPQTTKQATIPIVEFEQIVERGCGLDIHEKTMAATIDGVCLSRKTRTFDTFTGSLNHTQEVSLQLPRLFHSTSK